MKIESIRLKNIRSYGEGVNGEGITVQFRPGVNRVAGRNGHGKTTLIEALGYALFSCAPSFVENFGVPTYFLRSGEKDGEIDVVFEHEGLSYRVERGLGTSRRRSKVVQLSDGSTCAMDDAEVSAWLCRLFGFENAEHLSSLFSNLVGIKQGRLTRPFDSSKKEAKEFFEPLLEVAVFRMSTEQLADTQRRFRDLIADQENKSATTAERLRMLADSQQRVPAKEAEVEIRLRNLEKFRKQKEEADARKQALEQKHAAILVAKTAMDDAANQSRLMAQKREADQQRVSEADDAFARVTAAQAGHETYVKAEAALRILQQQQTERAEYQRLRAEALNLKTGWQARREFAGKQLEEQRSHREETLKQAETWHSEWEKLERRLQESEADFLKRAEASAAAQRARDAAENWIAGLDAALDQSRALLDDLLKDLAKINNWDKDAAAKLRAEEKNLETFAKELGRKLAKAEEARESLTVQLAQIRGGVCPFLKEKCRQFDAHAIETDLGQRANEVAQLERQHNKALESFETARMATQKLFEQEAGITHVQASLAAKTRRFLDDNNQICSEGLKKHLAIIQSFISQNWGLGWTNLAAAAGGCSADGQPNAERLNQLVTVTTELVKTVGAHFQSAIVELQNRFHECEKERADRVRQQRDLENGKLQVARLDKESKTLAQKLEALAAEATNAEAQMQAALARVTQLDGKLKPFEKLDDLLSAQNELKDRSSDAHKSYLGAKPLADQVGVRREALRKSVEVDVKAQELARQKSAAFETVSHQFDPKALDAARDAAASADKVMAMESHGLKDAERELGEARDRLKQYKAAEAENEQIHNQIGRFQAANHLAKLAGKVLKDAAPAVAQHLCGRIAANAQQIFNRINTDPIELEWKAEPQYSLRITPGERRFAMLSGGEQTKLAVAMTLAMIQQFSGLRFAVFDEPTYAVDAESRQKLADAIIEAQKIAGLDQLIVVSHDDSFEGKIENVVFLSKTSRVGTEQVISA